MDENEYRSNQIEDKVIVDCYNDEEISCAWECYMEERLSESFKAKIIGENPEIPVGEVVTVKDNLYQFDEIGSIIWKKDHANTIHYLEVEWNDEEFDIDIKDLKPLKKDNETLKAIKNWNYWIRKY
ncbi:MAG: calcium-binding protein [Methanobrevibacter sp.]|jgi:hypothetical protein|nr:calcium-binding protein [Candidatus Methanovirga meridionalis]